MSLKDSEGVQDDLRLDERRSLELVMDDRLSKTLAASKQMNDILGRNFETLLYRRRSSRWDVLNKPLH